MRIMSEQGVTTMEIKKFTTEIEAVKVTKKNIKVVAQWIGNYRIVIKTEDRSIVFFNGRENDIVYTGDWLYRFPNDHFLIMEYDFNENPKV